MMSKANTTERLGYLAAISLTLCVTLFAIFMITMNENLSYFVCIVLSWAYLIVACCYYDKSKTHTKVFALIGVAFAIIYVVLIDIVYFTQLTTVLSRTASPEILDVLSYSVLGSLMFNLDLLGYGMMAISTLFISFSINPETTPERWLKYLMMIHGVFAVSCVMLPMMNIFNSDMVGGDLIGTLVLVFWCVYFIPIGVLSAKYFKKGIDNV